MSPTPASVLCLFRPALLAVLTCGGAFACGPFFADTILSERAAEVLVAPRGRLAAELSWVARDFPDQGWRAVEVPSSFKAESEELRSVLLGRGLPSGECELLLKSHAEARASRSAPPASLSAELPREFFLYLEGARHWRNGDRDQAREKWMELLALPEQDRRHRSVWAAYMLGRLSQLELDEVVSRVEAATKAKGAPRPDSEGPLHSDEESAEPRVPIEVTPEMRQLAETASRCFAQARVLSKEGASDVLGLAVESLGWEGRTAYLLGDFPKAFRCYFDQWRAGDPSALVSLRWTAERALQSPASTLEPLAAAPLCRRLVSAYLVSHGTGRGADYYCHGDSADPSLAAWQAALSKVKAWMLPEADRLAWFCYEAGNFELSREWLKHASEASSLTWWLRAKFALREGELATAEQAYRETLARPGLAEEHVARVHAELGRVCLARDEFAEALDAWMRAGDWDGVAYLSERVLSLAQLKAWHDAHAADSAYSQEMRQQQRHLLARRLARAASSEAEAYFPAELGARHRFYVEQVRRAHDSSLSALKRGRAFMVAARIARHNGMELFGTEQEPDWFQYGGSYERGTLRTGLPADLAVRGPYWDYDHASDAEASSRAPGVERLDPTKAELEQVRANPLPQEGRRFHYRYRAAELAWLGASLLPNDSAETAAMLCEAGLWLKDRDPRAADLFYKALVVRCPRTQLGRQAEALHWFPEMPERPEPSLGVFVDWGLSPGWLALCWAGVVLVPCSLVFFVGRLLRRGPLFSPRTKVNRP